MTLNDIVSVIAIDLNITAQSSLDRIASHVQRRYKRVMAALGYNLFSRVSFEADLVPGSQEQEIADDSDPIIERIVSLSRQNTAGDSTSGWHALEEIPYEQMLEVVPTTDIPRKWCKKRVGATSTVFMLDTTIPDGATVLIEGEEHTSELDTDDIPAFPEAFHDILVLGAKADEYRKQKDAASIALAREMEGSADHPETTPNSFNGMLAQLRLKAALAPFQDIVQGKNAAGARKPWQVGWRWPV